MSRTFGTVFLWIAALIALVFGLAEIAALTGSMLAGWIVATALVMGQPLLITFLLCLLVGLELRFMTCRSSLSGIRRAGVLVVGPALIGLGLAAVVLSRMGLTSYPAHTMNILLIWAIAGLWLGVYMIRRSRV